MATLVQLYKQDQLVRINPMLGPSVMEERGIYLLPNAKHWLENTLPVATSNWNIEESPAEQMDVLIEEFCSGKPLAIGQRFRHLYFRKTPGIWELKTADIRMFGWFPAKDRFIVSSCDLAHRVKEFDLYHGYCGQVQRDLDALDLDPPKFISGENPNDVISNWHTP